MESAEKNAYTTLRKTNLKRRRTLSIILGKEEEADGMVKMRFMVGEYYMIARWLLRFTNHIRIDGQPELKAVIKRMVLELNEVYL